MRTKNTQKLVLTALFMAIGFVLPFLTGQIREIGKMLLPMHIPVFLCGMICGPFYGLFLGVVLPLFRSLIFGTPIIYPSAISMAIELAGYGFFSGLIFNGFKNKNIGVIYLSLISSMLIGRILYGFSQLFLLSIKKDVFTFTAFLSSAFITSFPGIVLQLVLVPFIMEILVKTKIICKENVKSD